MLRYLSGVWYLKTKERSQLLMLFFGAFLILRQTHVRTPIHTYPFGRLGENGGMVHGGVITVSWPDSPIGVEEGSPNSWLVFLHGKSVFANGWSRGTPFSDSANTEILKNGTLHPPHAEKLDPGQIEPQKPCAMAPMASANSWDLWIWRTLQNMVP